MIEGVGRWGVEALWGDSLLSCLRREDFSRLRVHEGFGNARMVVEVACPGFLQVVDRFRERKHKVV